MKKSSMIESAQTILGGIKENSQSIEGAHTKLGGMKKNPKDSKILSKNKKKEQMQWCSKSNEENKNKEKEPKPNIGGHRGSFYKSIPRSRNVGTKSLGYKH